MPPPLLTVTPRCVPTLRAQWYYGLSCRPGMCSPQHVNLPLPMFVVPLATVLYGQGFLLETKLGILLGATAHHGHPYCWESNHEHTKGCSCLFIQSPWDMFPLSGCSCQAGKHLCACTGLQGESRACSPISLTSWEASPSTLRCIAACVSQESCCAIWASSVGQ